MIGQTIAQYQIVGELGRGGMGVVYRAVDTKLDRNTALKFLSALHAGDPVATQRFIREARAASALDHPNICSVFELGETGDGHLFIAMPLYEGETLDHKIARGPIRESEVIDLLQQLIAGLAKAHDAGIVHRDLKPANVMITSDGVAKILDFGLAAANDAAQLTADNATLGTAAYMSPEQARGETVDPRTDLWSLGVILFEMITGRTPFPTEYKHAALYAILNEEPTNLEELTERAPLLAHLVERLLQKDASMRYATARLLQSALHESLHGGVDAETVTSALHPVTVTAHRTRRRFASAGAFLAVAALTVFAVLQMTSSLADGTASVDAELELALATQEYFQKDFTAAAARLAALAGNANVALSERRTSLQFQAELQLESGDTLAAERAVADLLDLEPPLITIAPHEAATPLGALYDQERKRRITGPDQQSNAASIESLAILPFQEMQEVSGTSDVGPGIAILLIAAIAEARPSIAIVERESLNDFLTGSLVTADTSQSTSTPFRWSDVSWNDPLPTGPRPFVVWADIEDRLPTPVTKASHYLTGSVSLKQDTPEDPVRVLLSAWIFDVRTARLDAWATQFGSIDQLFEVVDATARQLIERIPDVGE